MNELDTLADIVGRFAGQLKLHLPAGGYQPNQYGGYTDQLADIGRDRLAELAPSLVAYSEAVRNLSAARTLAPKPAEEEPQS